jgi:Ca2+/Na+ antiporter
MAVSHAFGSNTFNIMIGLGLPWVTYTSFVTGFKPYHGLADEGITERVFILGSVLFVFVAIVISSGFVLYRWHGILFIVLYVAFLAYEIARLYI